ncbi:MAG: hypothetical protein KAS23_08850 [Anaerohalosphaera sp.]|nr:hypothetical protein [Anaerohalosphaera sp.]
MSKYSKQNRRAFTLVEMIAVVMMAAMIVVAILGVHYQITSAIASINERLNSDDISSEVLQRIAEDLDRLASPGFDTAVRTFNKFEGGYQKAQLVIENKIYGSDNKSKIFERVIWHSFYDSFSETMTLYRSHGGIAMEDQLMDYAMSSATETSQASLQKAGQEPCVPICEGLTYFEISAVSGTKVIANWSSTTLPTALLISVSFAEPIETVTGEFEIPLEEIYTRTVAIDRTRKIGYKFIKKDFSLDDPNDVSAEDPNDISTSGIAPEDILKAIPGGSDGIDPARDKRPR